MEVMVNGRTVPIEVESDTPVLWFLREQLALTGTKFGCGMAQCGACTVHLNGRPIRSCVTPVSAIAGQSIVTIESIKGAESARHPVQQAWVDFQVPQCGYCQSGQIMSAIALLEANPKPSDSEIDEAMSGNICRCGMYSRIKKAIKHAATEMQNNAVKPSDAVLKQEGEEV